MKPKGTLLKSDGTRVIVHAAHPQKGFTIKELRTVIGNGCGTVQVIDLKHGGEMWLDEEGKLSADPGIQSNRAATRLLQEAGGMTGDVVMGNVVLFERGKSGSRPKNS